MDFKDQYKHPMWQKKRLDVLADSEFVCQRCFDDESQLHVHHRQYFKGRMIWEYDNSELEVLCESCHEAAHAEIDELKHLLSIIPTECVPGIAALIKGYASIATGPIRGSGITDEISTSNPDEYIAGQVAAASNMTCSIYEMQYLSDQLQSLFHTTGSVLLEIKERRSIFDSRSGVNDD